MPIPRSSYRFSAEQNELMDALGIVLSADGRNPLRRADVLRVGLRRLAEQHAAALAALPKKNPAKSAHSP